MENLYPCSFKCLKSVAVMVCVWLPPFLFFLFFFSVICYKQLVLQFLWLIFLDLLTVFFSQRRSFNTFSQKDVLFTVFGFFKYFFTLSIVVLPRLLKAMAIFFNFVVKTALICLVLGHVLVVSFVSSANQKPFVICTRVTSF